MGDEGGHVPHLHLLDGRDHGALVADLPQGIDPVVEAGPVVGQDADQVSTTQGIDGGHGDLIAPVVPLGHLAGVHHQDQGPLGHLLLLGWVHVHR